MATKPKDIVKGQIKEPQQIEIPKDISLDILPIKEVKDTLMPTSKPIHPNLPAPPFVMNIDTYIDLVCEEQKKTPQTERKRVLICIDDCVGYKMKKLNFLCSRHRHFNISVLVSTQVYRRLDPIMRINSTCVLICKVSNNKEFMKIEEEILENIPNYLEYYNTATAKRYDFLFFNIHEQKLYHNFNTLLWEK